MHPTRFTPGFLDLVRRTKKHPVVAIKVCERPVGVIPAGFVVSIRHFPYVRRAGASGPQGKATTGLRPGMLTVKRGRVLFGAANVIADVVMVVAAEGTL